ncbi:acetyltransferase-like isoleucine patch superfamily enzyme [Streptomyces sp. MJP52]|nr:acetyltransferase-like isoleucine patch superfamily enzyme [Streptomyces sp. MJP52]
MPCQRACKGFRLLLESALKLCVRFRVPAASPGAGPGIASSGPARGGLAGSPVHSSPRAGFGRFPEPVVIEDEVWIGGNAVVLPGVRIGRGPVIGAGGVVSRDVPPVTVAVGVPCRVLRGITDEDLAARGASRPAAER